MQLLTDPVLLIVHGCVGPVQEFWVLLRVRTVKIKCLSLLIADRIGPWDVVV